jgi:hypothetical protein
MNGESKEIKKDQGNDAPLIAIDTEVQDFIRFASDVYGMSFDDVLNATLRIGMSHLSGLMFAEREREVLENLANPGLRRDFGAIIVEKGVIGDKGIPR